MLNKMIHVMLIVTYVVAAIALGGAVHLVYGFDIGQSFSIGTSFALVCGLLHVASMKQSGGFSLRMKRAIEAEFDAIKATQSQLESELAALRQNMTHDLAVRDSNMTQQLRDLAEMVTQFAQKTDQKLAQAQTSPVAHAPTMSKGRSDHAILADVRAALHENRVELHVQPVVTLPQRKVAFFEGFTRLRDESGNIIMPAEFLRVAEASGLVAEIDNMLLLRCVQIARRMIRKDRRVTLFCNVSPTSLADESFFAQFIGFLRENRELSGALIFELGRDAFDSLSIAAERNLGRLFDIGYRFSLDRCDSIDMDLRRLERTGVRYVKMAGEALVRHVRDEEARPITGLERDFTAQDVTALFARYGIDLIADRVENESTVVELLELDIGFAQGNLFGAPKPVDDSALADETERAAPPALRRYG